MTGAVEIDPVTLVEVGLRLAGDDRRQVEDHLRSASDHSVARPRSRQVEHGAVEHARPALRRRRLHHVEQAEPVQADPAEEAVGNEPIGQLAADHPRRAGHLDTDSDPPLVFSWAALEDPVVHEKSVEKDVAGIASTGQLMSCWVEELVEPTGLQPSRAVASKLHPIFDWLRVAFVKRARSRASIKNEVICATRFSRQEPLFLTIRDRNNFLRLHNLGVHS